MKPVRPHYIQLTPVQLRRKARLLKLRILLLVLCTILYLATIFYGIATAHRHPDLEGIIFALIIVPQVQATLLDWEV